jgi:hypothetical protein
MPMMDRNSDAVAALIQKWLIEKNLTQLRGIAKGANTEKYRDRKDRF